MQVTIEKPEKAGKAKAEDREQTHSPAVPAAPAWKSPIVRVGQPGIVWLQHADVNNIPCPAHVTKATANGVSLMVVAHNSSGMGSKLGVRHFRDPFLKDNPDAARNFGGWAFFDELPEVR